MLSALRKKQCLGHWFLHFHEFPDGSSIYKPGIEKGQFNVLIVVQRGSGFPLFYEGSHMDGECSGISVVTSPVEVPQREGTAFIFDANIGRQYPMVKENGGSYILLSY